MISFLSFLAVFAAYLSTLLPSIGAGAGGERAAALLSPGAGPDGALWSFLGRAALAFLPAGGPAFRLNALSALLAAAALPLAAGAIQRLYPPKTWAPHALYQLERDRWRSASLWITAFLWALAPGLCRAGVEAGPAALGLFLAALVLRVAARALETPHGAAQSPWRACAFLAGFGAGQVPVLLFWLPGLAALWLMDRERRRAEGPATGFSAVSGLLLLLPAAAGFALRYLWPGPTADDLWRWTWPVDGPAALIRHFRELPGDYGAPGLALAAWGAVRMARQKRSLFRAVFLLWALAGPFAAAAFSGTGPRIVLLSTLALAPWTAWGLHHAGLRWPALRAAAALLVPLAVATQFPSGRGDLLARDLGVNILQSLPPGAILWNAGAETASSVLYQQRVLSRRRDVVLVRRPDTPRGRAEALRDFPPSAAGSAREASAPDEFLMALAADPGADAVFTDSPDALPDADPDTGRVSPPRFPEDAIPWGLAYQFFPSHSRRLVDPAVQMSLARLPFWWHRTPEIRGGARPRSALERYARARVDLARKFTQYDLTDMAEQEYLQALALDPFLSDACEALARRAVETGQPGRAAVLYARAAAGRPGDFDLRYEQAKAEITAGRPRAALEALRAAVRLDPAHEEARRRLAETLESEKLPREALEQWKTLRDRNPQEKTYPARLAAVCAALGRDAEALRAVNELLTFPLEESEREEAEALRERLSKK